LEAAGVGRATTGGAAQLEDVVAAAAMPVHPSEGVLRE